tara:strand:- start:3511 stop:3951 length:441 start_codon:yes stop_codon:yes gene_type:complete
MDLRTVEVIESHLCIESKNIEKAVSLFTDLMENYWIRGVNQDDVLWVLRNSTQPASENVFDAFSYFGYYFSSALKNWRFDESKEHHVISFCRKRKKWHDDDLLWTTLAPCFSEDSYIAFREEGGAYWKYEFKGRSLQKRTGHIEWV